jgi:hypothetical protein
MMIVVNEGEQAEKRFERLFISVLSMTLAHNN